ncbi:Sjogren's syndrome/scleroderma autoantigen 1 [anaerobic digester metagenome]
MKSDADIMADYLLRGGKMLARACPTCGSPLFEVKGETSCVVCSAHGETARTGEPEPSPAPSDTATMAPAADTRTVPMDLEQELKATITCLLGRVRAEPDPERCRSLMKCVKVAWDLLD